MDRYTVHTKAGIHISNSLVHGHVYQPPSQAEVREHQQDSLQPLIEHEQRLATQKKLPQTSKYKNISHNCNIFSKKFWNASDVLRMNSSYTWPGNANILLWFWGKVEDLKYIHPLIQVMGAELSRPPSPQSSPPAFQAKRHLSSMSCVYSRFSSQNTSYKW